MNCHLIKNILSKFYSKTTYFFTKKLRINTINSPKPINPNEKVAKKDNPIIKVLKLADIFMTISDEFEGLWE